MDGRSNKEILYNPIQKTTKELNMMPTKALV
jgi:hypothetical protein